MDDYSLVSLSDSRNEWCARLVNTLTPCVIEGLKSIFDEAWKLCVENDEEDKYLMTFQTFLSRIPKWNPEIIEAEKKRIEETSSCGYLEELITCVHVIHLKALTCVRVGQKQKKVDIDIPSVDVFIHKIYCNVARKLYTSVYLFEKNLMPLEIQKHNRELEVIIKECILNTVRDTMPIENILRAYMDETEELDVNEEIVVIENETPEPDDSSDNVDTVKVDSIKVDSEKTSDNKPSSEENKSIVTSALPLESVSKTDAIVEPIEVKTTQLDVTPLTDKTNTASVASASTPVASASTPVASTPVAPVPVAPVPVASTPVAPTPVAPIVSTPVVTPSPNTSPLVDTVNFKDIDDAIDVDGKKSEIVAPKTDERLEEIATLSAERRKREEEEEDEDDKLVIGDNVNLDIMDINDLNRPVELETVPILNDIEVLT